ncbi:MAG TPA: type VI secretion system baseplate subunit TssE [Paraburkholderia sp.]|jgi:type VI secretion system protein ImpF|nr:type VI secretion system baseplate subunit TssE [Paraburkholderia sp.]
MILRYATHALRRTSACLLPTLLDRLRDDAPHRRVESPDEYAVTHAQMRDIVQRDLGFLLNTTNLAGSLDHERYPHAAASTINYGVPPFAGAFAASCEWRDIETALRRAITTFEPRLLADTLSIAPLSAPDVKGYNVLRFEIRATMRMDAYPLEFIVQSSLDLETRQVSLTPARA